MVVSLGKPQGLIQSDSEPNRTNIEALSLRLDSTAIVPSIFTPYPTSNFNQQPRVPYISGQHRNIIRTHHNDTHSSLTMPSTACAARAADIAENPDVKRRRTSNSQELDVDDASTGATQ
jgi:hypothetical protein